MLLSHALNTRIVQPELLETYPDDHPDARVGREDLRLVNAVMGNHRWVERSLRRHGRPGWRILEIGAGDGALAQRLWQRGVCRPEQLHAVDLAGRPAAWPARSGWTQGDLLQQALPDCEVLIANLFLHHFQDDQIRRLGERLPPSTRLILAAEPARRRVHTFMGRLFCALAELHPITRHDMQVSIRAGFRGDELQRALGLGEPWQCAVSERPLGAYRFLAWRPEAG